MIEFYDMQVEAMREVTQDDWDLLWSRVERKHREICELQAVLRERGIPLPTGHKDRAGEFYRQDV